MQSGGKNSDLVDSHDKSGSALAHPADETKTAAHVSHGPIAFNEIKKRLKSLDPTWLAAVPSNDGATVSDLYEDVRIFSGP